MHWTWAISEETKEEWLGELERRCLMMMNSLPSPDRRSRWLVRYLRADQMGTSQWSISASRSLVEIKPQSQSEASRLRIPSVDTHSVCALSRIWCLSCWLSHSCRWKMKPETPCSFWLRSFTFSWPILACTNTMNFHVLRRHRKEQVDGVFVRKQHEWSCLHSLGRSLLPPGQQQAVIEQVQVHGLSGQLELGPGYAHHLSVHLQELTVFHQPAGLRDQREDLGG